MDAGLGLACMRRRGENNAMFSRQRAFQAGTSAVVIQDNKFDQIKQQA